MANPHATNEESTDVPTPEGWAYDFIASTQVCPMCLSTAVAHNTRKNGRVMLGTYECGMTHRWNLTWVIEKVTA